MNRHKTTSPTTWRRFGGHTLIELMAALVLSTGVVIALLGVTSRVQKHKQVLVESCPSNAWQIRLRRHFEQEYRCCQSVVIRPKRLTMLTLASTIQYGEPVRQLPALVDYQVTSTGEGSILVRTELPLVNNPARLRSVSSMVIGADRFIVGKELATDVPPGVLRFSLKGSLEGSPFVVPFRLFKHGAGP